MSGERASSSSLGSRDVSEKAALDQDFFVAGGTLRPNKASYVKRPADEELFDRARAGDFCYVLTPRQMGKSSLMIRTLQRLRECGVATAEVDLSSIGSGVTEDRWYLSILSKITRQLNINADLPAWWEENNYLSDSQRFSDFLEKVALKTIDRQVVIFIDEIDSTLNLDFRDDFFAVVRALYNSRASHPDLERLSFVLLGVASPAGLIIDNNRTPFNIGYGISLNEFSQHDARVLQDGLEKVFPGQGEAIFDRVYYWTSGQPYLTQKLCQAIAEKPEEDWTQETIDALVDRLFLSEEVRSESNLRHVQERILKYPRHSELLKIYQKVLAGRKVKDDGQSIYQNELKLAGLLKVEKSYLRVRNEIYRRAFNQAWVRKYLPVPWTRTVFIVLILLTIMMIGIFSYNVWVDWSVEKTMDTFINDTPANRLSALAYIYNAQLLITQKDYPQIASGLFYGALTRWSDQKALFDLDSYSSDQRTRDLVSVVHGLETTLVEPDQATDNQGYDILGAIYSALEKAQQSNDVTALKDEIYFWRAARSLAHNQVWEAANRSYKQAIRINPNNPATRFELARVLFQLNKFDEVLTNLDAVVIIVKRSGIVVEPTGSGALISTSEVEPTAASTKPGAPTSIPAVGPTTTIEPSNFISPWQKIAMVKEFIASNPQLADLLTSASREQYPNLYIVFSTSTPPGYTLMVKVTGTPLSTPYVVASPTYVMPSSTVEVYPPTTSAYVTISTTYAAPGSTIAVSGYNYPPNSEVDYRIAKRDQTYTAVVSGKTNSNGYTSAYITIPTSARAGEQWVVSVQTTNLPANQSVRVYSPIIYISGAQPTRILMASANEEVIILSGPGEGYFKIYPFHIGMEFEVLGISEDKEWFIVKLPTYQNKGTGWAPINSFDYDFNIQSLPVVRNPPIPTPATPPPP